VDTLEIVIIAVVAVFGLLALGGARAARRRHDATEAQFRARIEQANRDLAAAHAADKGWERERVEAAVLQAFAEQRPGVEPTSIELLQVIDPPGTDQDKAVFRVHESERSHRLTLGRRGDDWVFETLD
jgi:hypothetical protein